MRLPFENEQTSDLIARHHDWLERGLGAVNFPRFDFIEILMRNVIKLKRIGCCVRALQSSCAWILFNLSSLRGLFRRIARQDVRLVTSYFHLKLSYKLCIPFRFIFLYMPLCSYILFTKKRNGGNGLKWRQNGSELDTMGTMKLLLYLKKIKFYIVLIRS